MTLATSWFGTASLCRTALRTLSRWRGCVPCRPLFTKSLPAMRRRRDGVPAPLPSEHGIGLTRTLGYEPIVKDGSASRMSSFHHC
jgi:hypothetical protein